MNGILHAFFGLLILFLSTHVGQKEFIIVILSNFFWNMRTGLRDTMVIAQEVAEKYLDCGNPKGGFARIRYPDLRREKLLMFPCKNRGFCPSCHAKRREQWGERMREKLILRTPHHQVVFTIHKMLRIFFKYNFYHFLFSACL